MWFQPATPSTANGEASFYLGNPRYRPPQPPIDSGVPHVVGSQGPSGIPPIAPGSVPAAVKDADGKFSCSYCIKKYKQEKCLKRHLLRRKFAILPATRIVPVTSPG
jgi:hypothetical protein